MNHLSPIFLLVYSSMRWFTFVKVKRYKKVEGVRFNLVSEHWISGEDLYRERFSRFLVLCFLGFLFSFSFISIV